MTSRSPPAQSSFAWWPFAERFCIDCLACWHWAALARAAHSSPAIPAQTPCTSLESCFSAFISTAVHFAGQSERRAVPAKVQQLLPAIHDNAPTSAPACSTSNWPTTCTSSGHLSGRRGLFCFRGLAPSVRTPGMHHRFAVGAASRKLAAHARLHAIRDEGALALGHAMRWY